MKHVREVHQTDPHMLISLSDSGISNGPHAVQVTEEWVSTMVHLESIWILTLVKTKTSCLPCIFVLWGSSEESGNLEVKVWKGDKVP